MGYVSELELHILIQYSAKRGLKTPRLSAAISVEATTNCERPTVAPSHGLLVWSVSNALGAAVPPAAPEAITPVIFLPYHGRRVA